MASEPPKGWNDPPVLSYDIASDSPSRKTQLNKRVPFPNSGVSNATSATSDCSHEGIKLYPQINNQNQSTNAAAGEPLTQLPLPPPPSLPLSNPETQASNKIEESESNELLPKCDLQKETLSILKQCLDLCLKTLKKRTADDIERRLNILTNMWNEGKLNEDVQIRMYKFSQALYNGDYEQANNIHMSLIVDHVSQVTPWMVGVKHLIHESRQIGLNLASNQSSSETSLPETNSPSDQTTDQ